MKGDAGRSARAALAEAAEDDVVLGDLERDLLADLADRPLETAVLERLHPPAAAADRVVVVMAAGVDPLVAGGAARDLEPLHEAESLEHLERPVDARPADAGLARPQLLLQLQCRHRALMAGEGLDDGGAGAAAPVAGAFELRQGVLGPAAVDPG